MTTNNPVSYTLRTPGANSSDEAQATPDLDILRALASGNHPITGEPLSDDSCYQSAKVLRALLAAIKALEKISRAEERPRKAGASWTAEEDKDLARSFDLGVPIPELSRKHERTPGAIRSRLEKMGKIDPFKPTTQDSLKNPPT